MQPPVQRDSPAGFILSRALEAHGRSVSFAFEGAPPQPDGSQLVLEPPLLRESLNFRSLAAGQAYPLFYDTLFGELRDVLAEAAGAARDDGLGVWAADRSESGLVVSDRPALERDAVVFPKLFRRLIEFLREQPTGLAQFLPWLADKREPVLDLTTQNFTHFDNVLRVEDDAVHLTRRPEQLVFVSANTANPTVAPWLSV